MIDYCRSGAYKIAVDVDQTECNIILRIFMSKGRLYKIFFVVESVKICRFNLNLNKIQYFSTNFIMMECVLSSFWVLELTG